MISTDGPDHLTVQLNWAEARAVAIALLAAYHDAQAPSEADEEAQFRTLEGCGQIGRELVIKLATLLERDNPKLTALILRQVQQQIRMDEQSQQSKRRYW